jgi:hypothetical protein
MMILRWTRRAGTTAFFLLAAAATASAQGITTGAISARVTDATGTPRPDARVTAVHQPSGTSYEGRSRQDGRVTIPGMRVGGPYRVTATAVGFEPSVQDSVFLSLGVAADLQFVMRPAAVRLAQVTVTAEGETVFSSERTGAATSVGREAIATLPTITARIEDFARLTPQYSGSGFGFSFAGQDNRLNNVTIDGSYFNNSFGLAGQPGDRTGVAPISMDAIEQLQVNIAPYDVRQGNFVGAAVNTVTRSGTNDFAGSVYYAFRDNRPQLHGTRARGLPVDPGEFEFGKIGVSVGGPILRDKLFYFVNYESDELTQPGTTFQANPGGAQVQGNMTRVLDSDLRQLSDFLRTNFNYEAGPWQGYSHETPAMRFLAKLDYNLGTRHKLSVRYSHLDSDTDVPVSNSSSLGFGTRRSVTTGLNFQNSNYKILENIRSGVAEWNAMIGRNMSNNFLVGYSHHDESRKSRGTMFPFVDILSGTTVYTSFGFEPFTPNNELRYGSTQLQNNFSIYGVKHELTFGVSAEWYESENVFFPGRQSVYVYNSLADFYTDANGHLANPNRTAPAPVTLRRFQVRWSNIPGQEKPIQPLEVFYAGVYAQDQWRINDKVRLTFGLRVDRPQFANTGLANAEVDAMNFMDENGETVKYSTSKLPDPNLLFSPRFGFNWDVTGDRTTQVRGGTGIFTGRPAYVWISNQIGNNGVLTGFERLDNTTARPFHPDPDHYKPSTVTGAPAASYELAFTDPDFRFPQLWRSNFAVDRRLPWGLVGTGEFMYSKDVNGIYYINANLAPPDANFTGPDGRARWTSASGRCPGVSGGFNRINCKIDNAIVLKNQDVGYSWNVAGSLEKPFGEGTFVKAAYSYGVARNTVDPGSIAFGSWNNNQHSGDPNDPGVAFASTSPGHRLFASAAIRRNWFKIGATTASVFWEARTIGNASYTYSGDLNGDGGTSNDLIYIPRDQSEMNFQTYTTTVSNVTYTFTAQQQAEAWEAYIQQDKYLRANRGKYAERNAVFLPMFNRADFAIAQEVAANFLGARNGLEVRLDFLNFSNVLNNRWGVSQRLVNLSPLLVGTPGVDAQGRPLHRLRAIGNPPQLMTESLEQTAGISDVYRVQLGVRYKFN